MDQEAFVSRLKTERNQLSERVEKLEAYLDGNAPGATDAQRELLKAQLPAMNAYLQILEIRLENLRTAAWSDRPRVASEQSIGEAVETGGHDEDRDGPIPFGD